MNSPFFFEPPAATKSEARRFRSRSSGSPACHLCRLCHGIKSPLMMPYGQGKLGIMVVAEAPGPREDEAGRPLVGESGQLTEGILAQSGISMVEDCLLTNAIQCFPRNSKVGQLHVDCCYARLEEQIHKFHPVLILCFGALAVSAVLSPPFQDCKISTYRGLIFPSQTFKTWVAPTFHPAYILRNNGRYREVVEKDVARALAWAASDNSFPSVPDISGCRLLDKHADVTAWLKGLLRRSYTAGSLLVVDFETSGLFPWVDGAKPLLVGLALFEDGQLVDGALVPLLHPGSIYKVDQAEFKETVDLLRCVFKSSLPKTLQNAKFDWQWAAKLTGDDRPLENVALDTIIGWHVLDQRPNTTSLGFQSFAYFGWTHKGEIDVKSLAQQPINSVASYCWKDLVFQGHIANRQLKSLYHNRGLLNAHNVFNKALPLIAEMERRGVRLDIGRLRALREKLTNNVQRIRKEILASPVLRGVHGQFNPNSPKALQKVLFGSRLGLKPIHYTQKTASPSVSDVALTSIMGTPGASQDVVSFVSSILDYRHVSKLLGTYVEAFLGYADRDGLIHPQYSLHLVSTYRSSSSDPNFQNVPHRDPEVLELRRCIVPRNDYLLEMDLKGAELCSAAMLSGDRMLAKHIQEGRDIHADWVPKLFGSGVPEANKDVLRFRTKNGFVFPTIYGATPERVAAHIGVDVELAEEAQREFFGLYRGLAAWQKGLVKQYYADGYVETPLGFRLRMPMSRNEIINGPVQATAFHLFLLGLIDVRAEYLAKNLASFIFSEIHDSGLIDAKASELEDLVVIGETEISRKRFEWISVPLRCKWSMGENWGEMQEV